MACTSTTKDDIKEETALFHQDASYSNKLDEIKQKYPNFSYAYIPTDSGNIKTVKGDYKVAVDEVDDLEDEHKYIKYLEEKYDERVQRRDLSNDLVSSPARPKKNYPALFELLDANIERPAEAEERNIGGTVFVEFILSENGEITDVEASESIYFTTDYKLQQEFDTKAIEAIKSTEGHWTVAKDSVGNAVPMKIEIPITFPEN
nr:energy transducer TonB [Fulvivirga aurantia]